MNINELLNSRKQALLGSDTEDYLDLDQDTEATMENWGDISGDEDEAGELRDLFTDEDLQDIELEASQIEDPDEYIDNAIKEFNDETMALVGEMYIDELVTEDAVMLCESYEELESIEEAFKDTVKEKAGSAKNKIIELAKKFAAWIKNLKDVILNLFRSGESLVKKYKSKITSEYNTRGDKIKVKTYVYKHDRAGILALVDSITVAATSMLESNYKYSDKSSRQDYMKKEAGGGTIADIKKKAIEIIRPSDEKKEMTVKQIPLSDILDLAGNKKDYIKDLDSANKAMQKFFSDQIKEIKGEDKIADTKESKKNEQITTKRRIAIAKMGSSYGSAAFKAYMGQLKAANRAYTAIVRKLLNQSTAGGSTETKAMQKLRNR